MPPKTRSMTTSEETIREKVERIEEEVRREKEREERQTTEESQLTEEEIPTTSKGKGKEKETEAEDGEEIEYISEKDALNDPTKLPAYLLQEVRYLSYKNDSLEKEIKELIHQICKDHLRFHGTLY